jgi:type I restriction enzyme S subunit
MRSDFKLGDLIEIKYGKDHKHLGNGTIPVYGSGGVMRYANKYLYDNESILIPRKGTLNNVFYVTGQFWTVDTIFWSKINTNKVFGKFLFYYLTTMDFANMNVGSAVPSMTSKVLNDINITLPPLPTQKKIAHILSTLDDKIELNRKINQTLEAMAQALFKSWFVDFDPVHARLTYKSDEELEVAARELGISKEVLELFPSEFEESELGMIPKGWEIRNFKDLVEKYIDNRGKTPPIENEGIPLLEVRTLPTTMLVSDYKTDKYVSDETYKTWFRSHLETDDILISTVGTIGLTCIVPDNSKFTIAQNVLGIRFNDKLLFKKYMFYMMKSKYFLDAINARLVTTVQSSIKRKDIETIDIVLAPLVIQNKFIELITSMMSIMQSNEIQTLQKTRDTLLPKLLSGELDVSEIEID